MSLLYPSSRRSFYNCRHPFATVMCMRFHMRAFRNAIVCLVFCLLRGAALPQDRTQKKEPKRIWTNDDLEHLAARPLTNAAPSPVSAEPTESNSVEKHYVRAKDPKWYVSQLKPQQAQVEDID